MVAKFGVPPASIPDYLALVGDASDGYPGLPGWGAKSAAAVLERLPLLKYRNAHGSRIYIRPSGSIVSPRSTISARPRLRGSRPMAQ